jgi:hypothetical protein
MHAVRRNSSRHRQGLVAFAVAISGGVAAAQWWARRQRAFAHPTIHMKVFVMAGLVPAIHVFLA